MDNTDQPSSICHVGAEQIYPIPPLDPNLYVPFSLLCGEAVHHTGHSADGLLVLTNYRIYIELGESQHHVPLGLIEIAEHREMFYLHIGCKDARSYKCTFDNNEQCLEWFSRLMKALSPPRELEDLFAFRFYAWAGERGNEEVVARLETDCGTYYDGNTFKSEVDRLQFDLHGAWRISQANNKYKLCSSYPPLLLVPACITDETLETVARFRSSRRIPAVVWRHQGNGAVIARCSQPEVGWLGWRSAEDEDLLKAIADACTFDRGPRSMFDNSSTTPTSSVPDDSTSTTSSQELAQNVQNAKKVLIMDARSYTTAVANRARGGGCECPEYYPSCEIQFMNLANIHSIRKSFHALRQLCASNADQPNWFSLLEGTRWLQHMSGLMRAAETLVAAVERDARPVLVHCSDGWDRTPQIVALAELLLDPFYRTVDGFRILVEREWLSFGHKFADRCGHAAGTDDQNERCPVFLQWLDCVHQLIKQFPCQFQFSHTYLVKLAQHTYSNLFGTFLCNTKQERADRVADKTFSVWRFLNAAAFRNHLYCANGPTTRVIWPQCNVRDLRIWGEVYLGSLEDQSSTEGGPNACPGPAGSSPPHMTKTRSYGDLIGAAESTINCSGHFRRSSDPSITVDTMKLSNLSISQLENEDGVNGGDEGGALVSEENGHESGHSPLLKDSNSSSNQQQKRPRQRRVSSPAGGISDNYLSHFGYSETSSDCNGECNCIKADDLCAHNNSTSKKKGGDNCHVAEYIENSTTASWQSHSNNVVVLQQNAANNVIRLSETECNIVGGGEQRPGSALGDEGKEENGPLGRQTPSDHHTNHVSLELVNRWRSAYAEEKDKIELENGCLDETEPEPPYMNGGCSHDFVSDKSCSTGGGSTVTYANVTANSSSSKLAKSDINHNGLHASRDASGDLVKDLLAAGGDDEDEEENDQSESKSEVTLCDSATALAACVKDALGQSVETSTETLVAENGVIRSTDNTKQVQADKAAIYGLIQGLSSSAALEEKPKLEMIPLETLHYTSLPLREQHLNQQLQSPPIQGQQGSNDVCKVCAQNRRFINDKHSHSHHNMHSGSTSGKNSRYSTPPLYSRTPSAGGWDPNHPTLLNGNRYQHSHHNQLEVDGMKPLRCDMQNRLAQIVEEFRIKEEALQRELHTTRQALIQQVCHHCSHNDGDKQDDTSKCCECGPSPRQTSLNTSREQSPDHVLGSVVDSVCSAGEGQMSAGESLPSDMSWEAVEDGPGSDVLPTLWVPDHAVSRCTGCQTEFWLGRRKHHCRNCGRIFCADCSENSTPLPSEQLYSPVRVCTACFCQLRSRGGCGEQLDQQCKHTVAPPHANGNSPHQITASSN